jgi:two-component system chemotaxis response regulator CheB
MPLRINSHRLNASHRYELVLMAASAGGIPALQSVLAALPPDFPLPIAIVQHRTAARPNLLAHVLGRHAALAVKNAEEGEALRPGTVYLAPPDAHMMVRPDRTVALHDGRKIRHVRSSANPLFESAAEALHGRVVAVVLTGFDSDATDGVQAVKKSGGIVIAQNEETAEQFSMPHAAIRTGAVDHILPLHRIAEELTRLARAVA